ncbi:MAG TPA: hypothetical protein VHX17_02900 [Candidatus Cybelea sp.]|jgi:hypothetical protein|nr:hypothetical protein [Candidatus Cybelea sp.]
MAYNAKMPDLKRGSRIGAVLAVLFFGVLDVTLQGRYRLAPRGAVTAIGAILIVLLITTYYVKNQRRRHREWVAMRSCIVLTMLLNGANLVDVVQDVLFHPDTVEPTSLILTSLAIWSANVLVFSLLYWALDRGGPDARANGSEDIADFDFPASSSSHAAPGWQPVFLDYLFVGFTTATAFSPTEAMPLTSRAKGLMIVQSLISLVTIIIVAARAIGIIPSS